MIKHATLSINGLIGMDVPARKCVKLCYDKDMAPETLEDLFFLAELHKISHLWVRGDVLIPNRAFAQYDGAKVDLSRQNWTKDGQYLKTVSGWRLPQGGQHQVTIVFTDHCSWVKGKEKWMLQATDRELLITFLYLEEALKVDVASHPGTMGWAIINRDKGDMLAGQGAHLEECNVDWVKAARDLVWQLPPEKLPTLVLPPDVPPGMYLHKFDKRSAYLAAAEKEFYGTGRMVETTTYDGKQVGAWRVTARKTQASDLPPIFKKEPTWTAWIMGPYIRLLQAQGYEVEIHEGAAFKGRHQILSKFATFMFNKRHGFSNEQDWKHPVARKYAAAACKQIAVATVGITGYRGYEDHNDKRRPDIKAQTVARTYEVLYHNIVKYSQSYGLPVIVYMDALYYLSTTPDGEAAFAELVERKDKLGGFDYKGRIPVTPDVAEILQGKEAANLKLEKLNKIGWVK